MIATTYYVKSLDQLFPFDYINLTRSNYTTILEYTPRRPKSYHLLRSNYRNKTGTRATTPTTAAPNAPTRPAPDPGVNCAGGDVCVVERVPFGALDPVEHGVVGASVVDECGCGCVCVADVVEPAPEVGAPVPDALVLVGGGADPPEELGGGLSLSPWYAAMPRCRLAAMSALRRRRRGQDPRASGP